jgi:hypothetical protein
MVLSAPSLSCQSSSLCAHIHSRCKQSYNLIMLLRCFIAVEIQYNVLSPEFLLETKHITEDNSFGILQSKDMCNSPHKLTDDLSKI